MSQRWREGIEGTEGIEELDEIFEHPGEPAARRVPERRPDPLRLTAAFLAPLVVLAALYLGVAWLVGRQLPSQASVAGVHIGGMTPQAARERLEGRLGGLERTPVTIDLAGTTVTTNPTELGLAVDLRATLADATGLSFDPREVWHRLAGGGPLPLRTTLDTGRAVAALTDDVTAVDQPVVEPEITFAGAEVTMVRPGEGRHVDLPSTLEALQGGWPQNSHVVAVVNRTQPTVASDVFDRNVEQIAKPAVAQPLVVVLGRRESTLPVEAFAPALRMVAEGGAMQLRVDGAAYAAVLRESVADLEVAPVDAGVRLVSGAPQVVPDQPGRALDERRSAGRALAALTAAEGRPPSRRAGIVTAEVTAPVTTADAAAWGVQHQLAQVDLPAFVDGLPDRAAQTANIAAGADAIGAGGGRLLLPGESLSLVQLIGDPAGRFADAPEPGPAGAQVRPGGGLSQLASALYAAGWQAGVDLGPRRPHEVYLAAYPLGLDATYSWPDADVRLTNPGPGALLVSASVDADRLRVALWGRRDTAVDSQVGQRRDVAPVAPQSSDAWDCQEQPMAAQGFTVEVRRDVIRGRTPAPTLVEVVRYEPLHPLSCAAPPADPWVEPTYPQPDPAGPADPPADAGT